MLSAPEPLAFAAAQQESAVQLRVALPAGVCADGASTVPLRANREAKFCVRNMTPGLFAFDWYGTVNTTSLLFKSAHLPHGRQSARSMFISSVVKAICTVSGRF